MSIDKEVIAILLGDGHVSQRNSISITHSISQKDYMLYKVEILESYGFKLRVRETEYMSYGKIRKFIKAEGYSSTDSKMLRSILYPNGIKVAPAEFVNEFNFKDWSFIFMDDGRANSISHTNNLINNVRVRKETDKFTNRYEICTESFDNNSQNILVSNLLKNGVDAYISNRNRIVISKSESKVAFYEGVKDFIVPSMSYKIEALPSLSYKLR